VDRPNEFGEATAMKKLMGTLFWLATVAVALVPVVAEAGMNMQHNETLVRDRR
jgi:hypothetical protein